MPCSFIGLFFTNLAWNVSPAALVVDDAEDMFNFGELLNELSTLCSIVFCWCCCCCCWYCWSLFIRPDELDLWKLPLCWMGVVVVAGSLTACFISAASTFKYCDRQSFKSESKPILLLTSKFAELVDAVVFSGRALKFKSSFNRLNIHLDYVPLNKLPLFGRFNRIERIFKRTVRFTIF